MSLTRSQISAERLERRRPASIEAFNQGELVEAFGPDWTVEGAIQEVFSSYASEAYSGLDLTIWRNGFLLAIVRQGRDGRPKLTNCPYEW